MLTRALCCLLVLFPLAACSGTTDGSGTGATDSTPTPNPPGEVQAYSGGSCPTITNGTMTFESAGRDRNVEVRLPDDPQGAGLLMMWHGNGDSAGNFINALGGANVADSENLIVVAPDACCGDFALVWPVPTLLNPDPGPDLTLFDDMVSCLHEQFGLDRRQVYTTGFSAGALWSSYLVMQRSDYLAAAAIFSGGSDGGGAANPYSAPNYDTPVLLTHGGANDVVAIIDFVATTTSFAGQLRGDGHTAIVCAHNGGHTPYSGFQNWAWDFLSAHEWGSLPSPYADGNDPSGALPAGCVWQ